MPKFLVTGGAGFIGANLALELEKRDLPVVVADHHLSTVKTSLKDFHGETKELDVTRPFDLPGDFTAVFHQAAITDPRHGNDRETYDSNLAGFKNVLDFCLRKSAKLVFASSAGLYGNGPVPMHEDQAKDCLTAYGLSKLAIDELALSNFDRLPLVGLRYFNVYGPREAHKGRPASMVYHLWKQMREGKRPRLFKWGEHRRDFVYVKDVVEANLLALEAPSGIYNVGTGHGATFNELATVLNEVMGARLDIEYFDMPFDSVSYQSFTQADTRRATERLRFTARYSLREGVADYLAWLPSPENSEQ